VNSRLKLFSVALLLAGLTGCASVPADWGRSDVGQLTAARGRTQPSVADAKMFTDRALSESLTVDAAIQLAFINNPDLRRETSRLGFAAAEVYDAGRLANPAFSLSRLSGDDSAGGNVPQLTLGLAFNFANLLFLPANTRYAKAQFEATKLDVAALALNLASDVEAAWYEAVGAQQLAQMRDAAAKAQRASADLARRYFDAGNISARELAMEQAAASQAMLSSISAQASALEARSALNRLMGLSAGQSDWKLDARLAEPLPTEDDPIELQKLAIDARLDVASLRSSTQAIAERYGLTRHTRLINGIEVGVERERDYSGSLNVGPTLSLELPLFNWGGGRTAAIQAALQKAEAELDGRVLDVSNEVQLASAKVGVARRLADEYRHALIPQQESVVAEAQKEQNYMLVGIFEVILAKQQEYDAYAGYIEAIRDYWTARSQLARSVGRDLPSTRQAVERTIDAVEILRPKGGGMDHSHHSMNGMSHDMKGMDMETMPGMEGMDETNHSLHEAPSVSGCAALKDQDQSKVDPSVAKALQTRCDAEPLPLEDKPETDPSMTEKPHAH